MDASTTTTATTTHPSDSTTLKRKRSPSTSSQPASAPLPKASKTGANQLSINYLARQSPDDIPLINKDDSLPNLLHLLASYTSVLDRHESLASNLGARPLGPILIKRFERCFDAPPRVVASHHKASNPGADDANAITWLEVIEFARAHPTQFTLSTFSEGKKVCQFYYPQKQLRVQISEDDFLFINSGRCQELIPPLPIWEDEEKEVATCDVLDTRLKELTNAADMVAARTRQLSHRLKVRRAAILERRAEGGSATPAKATAQQITTAPPLSSTSGFTAVNAAGERPGMEPTSSNIHSDLLRHLESLPHNQGSSRAQPRQQSTSMLADSAHTHRGGESSREVGGADSNTSSLSPVPTTAFANDHLSYYVTDSPTVSRQPGGSGHRPSSSTGSHAAAPYKHNFSRPLPPALESSQPFRPLCQAHMDGLPRGQRVIPPCDRCRRLRMDCVKNLTSCAGCTKKHARCHWREVSREELAALDHMLDSTLTGADLSPVNGEAGVHVNGYVNGYGGPRDDESEDDDSNPLEDLEVLGEKVEREQEAAAERMREDEEGLQHARDLSRQGVEESLRSTQEPPDDGEAGEPEAPEHADPGGPSMRSENNATHDSNVDNDDDSDVDNDTIVVRVAPRPATTGLPANSAELGGFRAVNDSGRGWRSP